MQNQFQQGLLKSDKNRQRYFYSVTIKKMKHDRDEADDTEASWAPVQILDLKRVKEAIVSCGIH